MIAMVDLSSETVTVKDTVTTASILTHVKNNRIEYLLLLGLMHIIGATQKAYDQVSGVCI